MVEDRTASQVSWGARINTREGQDKKDCPAWVKPGDCERWVQKGLIVWQEETQHIIRLSATYALQVLDQLRSDDEWPEEGITIGEPVTLIVLERPKRKPEPAHHNPIHLSPRQTRVLLQLLEKHEPRLVRMSEEEEEERGRRLWNAYRILLDLAERRERSEATDDGESQR